MATSIATAERAVQSAFEDALSHTKSRASLFETEAALWISLLALGRAMITLYLVRTAARPRATSYRHEGQLYVLDPKQPRRTQLGTRFGKVSFTRPVGRRLGAFRQRVDLPVDRELGLVGGFSLGTVVAVVRLAAMMAFAQARGTFREFHEWAPSPRGALRMVDAVGAEAKPFLDQAPPREGDGEVLVIQVDGRGAPMITITERERRARPHTQRPGTKRAGRRARRREHPRPRRRRGDKSKNAKVAVLGVIYTLRKTKEGYEGPINKQVIGTFESHRALMRWLRRQADKRGYGRKKTLFLADGSDHIWRTKAEFFPKAQDCLDWFHVVEKLWEAGRFFHSEGSAELTRWVETRKQMLRGGKVWGLVDDLVEHSKRIPKTGPGTREKRKRLSDIITHYGEHAERMRYDLLRKQGLDIGTGAVEGAVRNVVAARLDGPGMRWGRERSELVLHLRCILLSNQWEDFVAYLAKQPEIRLPAQPAEATPHAAAV